MNAARERHLAADLLASVVVFLVALPLCLGIAIASGVPPALGLVTGIVGGLLVGALAGAPLQVSGPAAGLVVIVWELVQKHGLAALGVVVLLAGLMQLAAGLMRFGRLFQAVPPAVINGMLAGIGVLILASQFHVMLGTRPLGSGLKNVAGIPDSLLKGLFPLDGSVHHLAAGIGLLTIVSLVLWVRYAPSRLKMIPGALVAVVVGTVAANLFAFPIQYVDVPENLLGAANWAFAGGLERFLDPDLLLAAAALAIIASAETLLCATATDRMHAGPRADYDRELAAQGVGNIVCGVFGALPITGVIVRSSANVQAGAKTRASAILHGGWLFLFVVAAPFVLRLIPVAALAALLVFTGWKLATQTSLRSLLAQGRTELAIYLATIGAIVATDLLKGVLFGFALGILKLVWKLTHLKIRVEDDTTQRRSTVHLEGAATFLALPELNRVLAQTPADRELHVNIEGLGYVDHACLEALSTWEKGHLARGAHVVLDWDALHVRERGRGASTGVSAGG